MTPKEKAKELIDKYLDLDNYNNFNLDLFCDECGMSNTVAKICALIAVDEIFNHHSQEQKLYRIDKYFWQEVKRELNESK